MRTSDGFLTGAGKAHRPAAKRCAVRACSAARGGRGSVRCWVCGESAAGRCRGRFADWPRPSTHQQTPRNEARAPASHCLPGVPSSPPPPPPRRLRRPAPPLRPCATCFVLAAIARRGRGRPAARSIEWLPHTRPIATTATPPPSFRDRTRARPPGHYYIRLRPARRLSPSHSQPPQPARRDRAGADQRLSKHAHLFIREAPSSSRCAWLLAALLTKAHD